MTRQQVLSSIHQNQIRGNNRTNTATAFNSKKHPTQHNVDRMRSASLSSLSSVSSIASSSKGRMSPKAVISPSMSPDENKAKRERKHFVEMFSPVRAIRAARAGMKRKRGGGPLAVAPSRNSTAMQRGIHHNNNRSSVLDGKRPAVDEKRTIRRSRRTESRDASKTSLHSGMKAMVLTDNDSEFVALPNALSNRRVSNTGSVRSTRSRLHNKGREDSEDEVADDAEEDERLLLQAPSWQLHRLKKTKLFKLHIMLGTWEHNEVVDLDLYNKQELVEGLVKARSSSIISRNSALQSGGSQLTPAIEDAPRPISKASLRRSTLSNTRLSMSSAYTDEEESGSEVYANDAGGEETEAEPIKSAKRRQDLRLSRLHMSQGVASPMVNRLRKARPRTANSGDGQSRTNVSSRVASPMGKRMFPAATTIFAASSPARTRLRTRNQSSASLLRLSLPVNRSNAARDVFPRRTEQQTPKQQRRKREGGVEARRKVDFRRRLGRRAGEDRSVNSDDQLEWEDTSPTSLQRYTMQPPRRAKVRAQEQLYHLQDYDQQGEEAEVDMSVDETPTKANLKMRSSQTRELDSDSDLSSDEGKEVQWDEEESHASETDIHASPSKMRKLRNGKIRLLATNPAVNKLLEEGDEQEDADDIEMGEVESITEVGNDDVPTSSSLNRLKKDELIQLCERSDIRVSRDATKAALVEVLLSAHFKGAAPDSSQTQKAGSVASNRTAGPDSGSSLQTNRGGRLIKSREQSLRLSDKPLLLRSHSNEVQRSKPPSPIPAGEEELNGLDLESLNLTDKEIAFNKLEKLEKIGSGGFKDVYIGKYHISKKSTKRVAISDIRDQLSEMDIKELGLLRDLKHENIVRFIGVCIPPPDMRQVQCMIVSELCSNGDLFDYIRNVPAPADEEIFRIMLETARGLEYLHTRTPAIIHRDCKSTNVLVTRNRTAKINDFGLARVRNTKRSMIKSLVGTVNWQAVELWSPKPNYNEKVDVWSAAMTFWETLQWHQPEKKYPFQEMNEHQIYLDVGHKKLRPSTVSIRRNYGGEIVDLLDEMWDHNPKERPTMTEVCQRLEDLIVQKKQISKSKILTKAIR